MKKMIVLVAILSLVVAGIAFAGVVSSKHDLRTTGTTNQVCVFCHHPHGNTGAQNNLLWNINDSDVNYVTYGDSGTTVTGVTGAAATAPQTTLCMGCHDGSGAANTYRKSAFDGTAMTTVGSILNSYANLGETLADDHPVGFTYPDATNAKFGDLAAKAVDASSASGYSVASTYPTYGTTLVASSMECGTCHDVHAGNNSVDTALQFMRGTTAASAICIDCHTTK